MSTLRILGIDPGYDRVGWCVLEQSSSAQTLVAHGCIETDKTQSIFPRFTSIFTTLVNIVKEHTPSECAIESLFFEKNVTTAMRVSEAKGLIIACMLQNHIQVAEYSPLQIKSAITGNGRATKDEVQRMVKLLTKLERMPKLDDEVDAIATALCHAASRRVWLAKANV